MQTERIECDVKVQGTLGLSALLDRGGELLGQGTQRDIYLAGQHTVRIREEGG